MPDFSGRFSRRRVFAAAGGVVGLAAGAPRAIGAMLPPALVTPRRPLVRVAASDSDPDKPGHTDLPVDKILQILPGEYDIAITGFSSLGMQEMSPLKTA